jgi:hypothetical protein
MTLTEKRLLKKKAKIYFISLILFTVLSMLTLLLAGFSNEIFGEPLVDYFGFITVALILIMPLFFALISMNVSSGCTNTLRRYKSKINECRQYKFFYDGIKAIVDGDIEKALFIHDRLLSNDYGRLNSKFYYFLANELSHSKNKKYKKMGGSEIADILVRASMKMKLDM